MKFCFGDIVVIHGDEIGVVVKCWQKSIQGKEPEYDVYCRMSDTIECISERGLQRYMVRHKYLDEQELDWQRNSQM